jgi:chitinase
VRVPQAAATGAAAQPSDLSAPQPDATQSPATEPRPADQPTQSSPSPSQAGRTAYDPQNTPDNEPPSAVATITPAEVTANSLRLTWPAATDNNRVIGYRIWLNGYEVATTAETEVRVRWFNDEEGQHVVQIKAIDAAGNQSTTWPTLLVRRPSPEPTASHTPTPTTTAPDPTSSPTPTGTQSTAPTTGPTAQGTSIPTSPGAEPTAGTR